MKKEKRRKGRELEEGVLLFRIRKVAFSDNKNCKKDDKQQ